AKPLPEDLETVQQYGAKDEEALVSGKAEAASVSGLLDKLAALGKFRVEWSPPARQQIQHRTASLAVDGVPLLEIVQALVDAQGMVWFLEDGALRIVTGPEAPKDKATAIRLGAPCRAL